MYKYIVRLDHIRLSCSLPVTLVAPKFLFFLFIKLQARILAVLGALAKF
jgi:hypothetical protein